MDHPTSPMQESDSDSDRTVVLKKIKPKKKKKRAPKTPVDIHAIRWTVEDDKMLMYRMAHREVKTNYTTMMVHFPGKTREQIRARYISLVKWMLKHPHSDLAYAPRKIVRRPPVYMSPENCAKRAFQRLRHRIRTDFERNIYNRINSDSTEREIEDAIVQILRSERLRDQAENAFMF